MNQDMAAIAKRMKERRIELGLSYQDMADKTGMSKSSIQRYETGGIANIPLHRLKDIASALKVSPEWLMGWDSRGVLTWSMDFRFSEQETQRIQEHFQDLLLQYKQIINTMANFKKSQGIGCEAVRQEINSAIGWLRNMPTYIDPSIPRDDDLLERELVDVFNTLTEREKIAWIVRIEDSIENK